MSRFVLVSVSLFSLVAITLFYRAVLEVEKDLSPQGCRMSYMYPSYILQDDFNTTWTPLAKRYSLWLYRESSHEPPKMHRGAPVLFIPGNAGSSRQVRSIASSAARQYFTEPFTPNAELVARGVKPLDFFAVEFNEDLSAFHGPTLESETEYTSKAVSYILSMYPKNTSILILGHSMGGIVATSLPRNRISAILTMSTPHALPPARFDHRVEEIYDQNLLILKNDLTPIISLCGGATDMMIPSESCFLPPTTAQPSPFRRTVFSSGLEGAWTGVGHQVMVWCHQVRWRIAKAALELEAAVDKTAVLDQWLSDGHILRPIADRSLTLINRTMCEFIPSSMNLILRKPRDSPMYLLAPPVASSSSSNYPKLVLYVSQGAISSLSTQDATFQVEVFVCTSLSQSHDAPIECTTLKPSVHRLIPNPPYGKLFPAPEEGIDESDEVVLFEADIPPNISETTSRWVGVQIQGAKGSGWVVGGFQKNEVVVNRVSIWRLLFGKVRIAIPDERALRTSMSFPRLLSDALVVYRADLYTDQSKCIDPLLLPLMMLSSHESETHYYPLTRFNQRRILLHAHSSAPFSHAGSTRGLNFTIHSSGTAGCSINLGGIDLRLDWKTTFGRWASRYFTVIATWSVGVVAVIIFNSWGVYERTFVVPSVQKALSTFSRGQLLIGLMVSLLLSFVPLPEIYYLGNVGNPFFAVIAPILLLITSGLVLLSWWILVIVMWITGKLGNAIFTSRISQETTYSVKRTTLASMCLIFLLVFLFIPWQVAYLTCWLIHFWNCSFAMCRRPFPGSTGTPPPTSVPRDSGTSDSSIGPDNRISSYYQNAADNYNQSMHLLLLMTWLLPLAAPVLVVWVRTLATAGLTTPFDGDHFVLNVAPFLILVDFASWTAGPLFVKQRFERGYFSIRSCFALLAVVAFVIGPRKAYVVFDIAKVTIGLVVAIRVGPRYWGRSPWSV